MGPVARREKSVHRRQQRVRHLRRRQSDLHHPGHRALHRRPDEEPSRQSVRLRMIMSAETSLTAAQRDDLRVIAAMMIPESDEYKVPGADDAAIQRDIVATLGRDTKMVAAALDHIAKLAGKPLASLDEGKREAVVTEFRASGGAPAAVLA